MTRSGPPGTELEIAEDDHDEVVPPEAEGLAATVLFAIAAILMILAPFATRPQPPGRGWYLAPINWPLVSLGLVLLAGGILVWRHFRARARATESRAFDRASLSAFDGMRGAIEYSFWFCLYLLGVSYLGFAIATLIFLQLVVWRAGLRGWKWVMTAFLVTVAIVVIFRLGVGLWFPLAPIFRLMPAWVGNTLGGIL
jgi:hypothetical protein